MRHQSVPLHRWTDRGTDPPAVASLRSANGFTSHQQFWTASRRPFNRPGTATTPLEGTTMRINDDPIEVRDWITQKVQDALDEAACERTIADADDLPDHDRRIAALSDLVAMVRTYQSTGPMLAKAAVLMAADEERGLHPHTWLPLDRLALHQPEEDLYRWLDYWLDSAIAVEDLEVAS